MANQTEIDILRELAHPNIVRLNNVYNTKNHVVLDMEYCGCVNLAEYVKNAPNGTHVR